MMISRIENFVRGWFVGNFEPSIHKTEAFEVGVVSHKMGEIWPAHYHKESREINLLISGKMRIQGRDINEGDIFVLEPWEIADPVFLEDCKVLVVRNASVKGDKYELFHESK
jgi:quercetin dioxygenase-like cupin family protein